MRIFLLQIFFAQIFVSCGLAQTKTDSKTIKVDNFIRSYKIHLPSAYDKSKKYPLVIYFHSASSRETPDEVVDDEEKSTGLSVLADKESFVIAYPEATNKTHVIWGSGLADDPSVDDDLKFVSKMLDEVFVNVSVDKKRIYAAGFSSGGGFVTLLAHVMADKIAAFASVSGYFPNGTEDIYYPSHPVPLLEIHGTADRKVSYDGIGGKGISTQSIPQFLKRWASIDKCNEKPDTVSIGQSIQKIEWKNNKGVIMIEHYKIEGGGHIWPINGILVQKGKGEKESPQFTSNFDATETIWNFCKQYSLK